MVKKQLKRSILMTRINRQTQDHAVFGSPDNEHYDDDMVSVSPQPIDLWTDPRFDHFDFAAELQAEYQDLGYNPRAVQPVGRELVID